jgi:hypothetical protein
MIEQGARPQTQEEQQSLGPWKLSQKTQARNICAVIQEEVGQQLVLQCTESIIDLKRAYFNRYPRPLQYPQLPPLRAALCSPNTRQRSELRFASRTSGRSSAQRCAALNATAHPPIKRSVAGCDGLRRTENCLWKRRCQGHDGPAPAAFLESCRGPSRGKKSPRLAGQAEPVTAPADYG